MSRALLLLMLGIFFTALFLGAISVYAFHDVDQDKIAHLSEAFAGLSVEAMVFSLIISGAVGPLSLLGRQLFKLRGSSPRPRIGLLLGIAAAILQYPCDFVGRRFFPAGRTLFSVFIW
jgi:ABC-type Fe3+ transport system permease subunit